MKIYWDYENGELLSSLSAGQKITELNWILSDLVTVQLYLVTYDPTTTVYTIGNAPSGYTPKFGIKQNPDTTRLVFEGTWTKTGDGLTAIYTAEVSLNVSALISAVESETDYKLTGIAEFVLQTAGGDNRCSTQVDINITEDINQAGDAAPDSEEAWPWMEEYADAATGKKCLRFKNSDGEVLQELTPPGV